MSPTLFYREQAQQQLAAEAAAFENVRDRCHRASNAWTELAERSERNEMARSQAAARKHQNDVDA